MSACQNGKCGGRRQEKSSSYGYKSEVPHVVCPGTVAKFGDKAFGDLCKEEECLPTPCKVDWSFLGKEQSLKCPDLKDSCPGKCEKSRSGQPCGCGQ